MLAPPLMAALLTVATPAAAAAAPSATNFSWAPSLGQHRAIITLPASRTPGAAVWATVPWQRRPVPDTTTTDAVLTVASTGAVVANAVRAPAGPGIKDSEALRGNSDMFDCSLPRTRGERRVHASANVGSDLALRRSLQRRLRSQSARVARSEGVY